MKITLTRALALCLLVGPSFLHAATWDGGAGTSFWEDANNWNPDGVPGSSGNADTAVAINTAASVSLTSDITLGGLNSNFDVGTGATLSIGTGARIGNFVAARFDNITTGGATVIFNDGIWSQDVTSGGTITIGRVLNSVNAGKTTKFQINGGTVSNLRTTSAGRIDIGHGDNLATAILEVTGGALTNSSVINFQGGTTGNAHFLISGGSVSAASINMAQDASSGLDSLIRVTGDAATVNVTGTLTLAKNASNTSGTSTAAFVFDNTGISKITATTLNLGAVGAKGLLDVDVSLLDSDGTVGFTLFNYTTLQNGTFGSVSVKYDGISLTAGTIGSLGLNQYGLDYGDGSSDEIKLYYNVIPEPSTWALLMGSLAVTVIYRLRRRRA